ncbi:MAG TPA: hypothetical protein VE377_25805 [Candidatus Dormibacteraeota bacterium]|nr:hypothetical protein [Candidatus Dormibacteraeota bacterium]
MTRGGAVKEFLEFLIGGFYAEYEAWDKRAEYAEYFEVFRKARFRSFGLIGHAYFHMGYDLPVTIATSFEAKPGLSIFAPPDDEAETTFVELSETFVDIFEENSSNYECNGVFALFAKVLPVSPVARTAATWVTNLRMVAWFNARRISRAPTPAAKDQVKAVILQQILAAGRDLARHKWNPIQWLSLLPAPTRRQFPLLLLPVSVSPASTPVLTVVLIIVGYVLVMWVFYLVIAYWGLDFAAEFLGRDITHRLEELLTPEERLRLNDLRREERGTRGDEGGRGRPRPT